MDQVITPVCGRCGSEKTVRQASRRHQTMDGVWVVYYRCRNCNASFLPRLEQHIQTTLSLSDKTATKIISTNVLPSKTIKEKHLRKKGRPCKNKK